MLFSTDGWVVGDTTRAWLDASSPTAFGLSSVWMLSPDEGWAVGGRAVLHYQVNDKFAVKIDVDLDQF